MNKSMLWTGTGLILLGVVVFAAFVAPHIVNNQFPPVANAAFGFNALAVLTAGLGIAAGCFLVGVGWGRWKHPRPAPTDGSPEV
jgi:hypothetical protein